MGAFAPSPLMTPDLEQFTLDIAARVLEGMREAGETYRGFLYVSLMLTPAGPKVIEFNVRLGDPEAQVILPQLTGDFGALLHRAAAGGSSASALPALGRAADQFVGVVLASGGYPASVESGRVITGFDRAAERPGVLVFHAATRWQGEQLVTSGGRVLTVVGRGASFEQAMQSAYAAVGLVAFEGMQYRRDIGRKAIGAEARS
jgi:phosphoribosylamine--glycine ligase